MKEYIKYNPETGDLIWIKKRKGIRGIGQKAGSVNTHHKSGNKYVIVHTNGRSWKAHRLAWFLRFGHECPFHIDHINGNGLDNRWCNLRMATPTMNSQNQRRRPNAHSDVMGVRWYKKTEKWTASIFCKGVNYHLGLFENFDDAVRARKEGEVKHKFHENHGKDRPF